VVIINRTQSEKNASHHRLVPISSPTAVPTTNAMENPMAIFSSVAAKWSRRRPLFTISRIVSRIVSGAGRMNSSTRYVDEYCQSPMKKA
jgi:hypothetical protein